MTARSCVPCAAHMASPATGCECGYHTRTALKLPALHWVIVGGESGPNARPMHPEWARSLRDQCVSAGVPFFFKQWGEWVELNAGPPPHDVVSMDDEAGQVMATACDGFISLTGDFVRDMASAATDEPYRGLERVGKKAAGRLLDGRTWDEVPK